MKDKDNANTGIKHNSIALGTCITGSIDTDCDLRIDGIINGNVHCKNKVVLGASGQIMGDLTCVNAEIMGHIEGKITVTEQLSLKATSLVKGDVVVKVLSVEPAAIFDGTCKMRHDSIIEGV